MRDGACSEGLSQSDQIECKPIIHRTRAAGSAILASTRLVPDLPGNVPCQVMAPLSVLQSSVHPYLVYAVHRGVESKLVIQGNTDCINLICGPVLSTEQNGPEMSDVSANS